MTLIQRKVGDVRKLTAHKFVDMNVLIIMFSLIDVFYIICLIIAVNLKHLEVISTFVLLRSP